IAAKQIVSLSIKPDYIIRALSSREMISSGKRPLDLLCFQLAKHYGVTYNPYLLMKKDFHRPLHGLTKKKRMEELQGKYVFNMMHAEKERPAILIIDDIVTTGTTMIAIRE